MPDSTMIGSRIRERRMMNGIRQSELAQKAGISASYLNLIEHNRRRIGGRTLLKLAEVLEVEPSLLSEGAEAALITALREAAAAAQGTASQGMAAELDRTEEFAGRFPGWAALLADLNARCAGLEGTVKTLTDRLAHDPQLAASLHEVISTVTAVRSTASILAETKSLEPEWQARFHRNINEDSLRLAEGAQALVRYLEGAPDTKSDIRSPQDELHAFLEEHGFHFSELEGAGGAARIKSVLGRSAAIETASARSLAQGVLEQYVRDARALPLEDIRAAVETLGVAPEAIAAAAGVAMPVVFRRLAMLPEALTGPVGLVICDGSGTLVLRKPALGFVLPRAASACVLWPLYQVLAQPGVPVQARLRQADVRVRALAINQELAPAGFEMPALMRPHMLILPDRMDTAGGPDSVPLREVGASCQVCPLQDCPARREPSILTAGF